MAHLQPGDIIFFEPARLVSRLNVLGQTILTRRRARWSHVAMCVSGPLVIHATPRHLNLPIFRSMWLALTGAPSAGDRSNPGAHDGGAHLELLRREYISGATLTVMRPYSAAAEAGFEDRLREAATYWLAQPYSFVSIYLAQLRGNAAVLPGRSFCSFLVQQICARMGLDRFGRLGSADGRTLMPGELFDLLSNDRVHWVLEDSVSLAGSHAEERLNEELRARHPSPSVALANHLAQYTATMAMMMLDGQGRVLQIKQVQHINQMFAAMNTIREQIALARIQLPVADVQKLVDDLQSKINPLLDRVNSALDVAAAPRQHLLFMNYKPLLSIVLAPKGSSTLDLQNHWMATQGGATLQSPDEDFVDRYIASQNAITSSIELRLASVLSGPPDPRWDLPADLPATLALIDDDIRRLDACGLSDWRVQRTRVRELLVRMRNIVMAAQPA